MSEHEPVPESAATTQNELADNDAFEKQHRNEVEALFDFCANIHRMRFGAFEGEQEEFDAAVYRQTQNMIEDRYASTSSAFKIAALSAGLGATTNTVNRNTMTHILADLLGAENQSHQAVDETMHYIVTDTQLLDQGIDRQELFPQHAQVLDNAASYLLRGNVEDGEKAAALARVSYAMLAAVPESNLYHAGLDALEPCLRQVKA